MPVDYNLVVIGHTPAGIAAASQAAKRKARVALVTQSSNTDSQTSFSLHHWLLDNARHAKKLQTVPLPDWKVAQMQAIAISEQLHNLQSSSGLAALGVDVIAGSGKFCSQPDVGFMAEGRLLQARSYLLAPAAHPLVPVIAGLESAGYLTASTLNLEGYAHCQHVVVIGATPLAVELAQAFVNLGIAATLITQYDQCLPNADWRMGFQVQAQLEADGVEVLTRTRVQQVQAKAGKKQVVVGDRVIETDEIVLAAGNSPDVTSLNLEAVGVKWNPQGIWHNNKLQTTNPRIYVCEGSAQGDRFPHVATAEAAIAVKNALFFPVFTYSPHPIPCAVYTTPELAWVGLTEFQARQRYGNRVQILQRSLNTNPKAQIRNDLNGLCKLIVHRNGRLLGAHLLGAQASESIGILALALQRKLNVQALATLALPTPTLAELIQQTAADYDPLHLNQHPKRRDLLDNLFDVLRFWSS